jgi:hypothetical protein
VGTLLIAVVDRKKRASRLLELVFCLLSSVGTPGAALPQNCFQKRVSLVRAM